MSEAGSIIVARYGKSIDVATSAFNDAYNLINIIMDVAHQISITSVDISIPITTTIFADNPPNIDLLSIGTSGIPADVEQAMWDTGLEKAQQLLEDSLDKVRRQWSTYGWPMANGTLTRMVMDEIDKYEEARRASSLSIADKSMDLAADFARITLNFVAAWSMATMQMKAGLGVQEAELRLKQADIAINNLVTRMKMNISAVESAANIGSQLVTAAFVGTAASASVHAGDASSNSATATTNVSHSTSTEHSETKRTSIYKSTNRTVDSVDDTDITTETIGDGYSDTTGTSNDSSDRTDTSTSVDTSQSSSE